MRILRGGDVMARRGLLGVSILIIFLLFYCNSSAVLAQPTIILNADTSPSIASNAIPFEYFNHYIFVTLTINGTPGMEFLFDTGTSADILNLKTSQRLGLKPESIRKEKDLGLGDDKVAVAAAKNVDVKMGSVQAAHVLAIVDLHGLELVMGHRIDGILGYPVLRHFIVELDFKNQMLRLLPIKGYKYHGRGDILFLRQNKYYATVPVILGTSPYSLHDATLEIDTGSGATLLIYSNLVRQAHLVINDRQPENLKAYGVGGYFHVQLGTLESMSLGRMRVASLPVFLMDTTPNLTAKMKFGGVVGTAILEKYQKIIFDVPGNRIIFERDPTISTSENQPMMQALTPLLK